MKLRFLLPSIVWLCCFGGSLVRAQQAAHYTIASKPRITIDSAAHSIIVKFRTVAAMNDPAIREKLQSISATSDVMRPVFRTRKATMTVQSVAPIGLERIVQIPLRVGMSAQDAVHNIQGYPASRDAFEYVEANYRYHVDGVVIPNDSLFSEQWWLANVHAPEAWDITEGDSTVHIGFVDTGVDWFHPDLHFQFAVNPLEDRNHNGLFDAWPWNVKDLDARGDSVYGDIDSIDHDGNGYANDVIGYNFVDQESRNIGDWSGRDPYPFDENGHGTMVAGVLAAQQNNGIGVSGIAPKCKLVALRAFDATGNGEDDDIASAIVYAADNHIQILNLSFGDIVPSLLQRDAIRYATSKGTLVVASSGNEGGDGPHYPSDFDEVLSVGATTNNPAPDNLFAYTSHGEGMDVVAPGDDIITTAAGGGYTKTQGTSFSSPIAAGVAALLLSKHPNFTQLELRSVIESNTQDILASGYDHETANGRVDALRVLQYQGGAAIKLTSPHTMDEVLIGDTVRFTGSAMSTLFSNYSISYAFGVRPDTNRAIDNWNIIQTGTSQVLDGALGAWSTRGLRPGFYTVRLAVQSTDNRSTEEHIVIWLSNSDPQFVSLEVDTIWVNITRALLIKAISDVPTTFRIDAAGTNIDVTKSDDRLGLEHSVVIKSEDVAPGIPLVITATLSTPKGETPSEQMDAAIPNEGISQVGFSPKPYSLPAGYALDSVFSTMTGPQVIESVFPDGLNFGPLKVFSFDGKAFHQVDSLPDAWIPRALGNTQGDGQKELLLQIADTTVIYKQNTHGILGDIIFKRQLWGGTLADLNRSGKDEIIGYGGSDDNIYAQKNDAFGNAYVVPDSIYYAYKWNGSGYDLTGWMPNLSKVDHYNNPSNSFVEPNAAHADLRGTGLQDLIAVDHDADLIVFEYDSSSPTHFKTVLTDQNQGGQSEGSLVTIGDFDGDGRPDIAYAYHSVFSNDTLGEYAPGYPEDYWTVKVLRNIGGMKFETMYFDRFYFAKPLTPYRSSVRAMRNVTGRAIGGHSMDDLVLSLFPNFYLLEYDSVSRRMKPIWNYPVSASPRGALAYDFDGNGKREFGFVIGDSIRFFESDADYARQTPAPGGLNVSPRDVSQVNMDWGSIAGATTYNVYRSAHFVGPYSLLGSSTTTNFSDITVNEGDTLFYAVTAVDSQYAIPESPLCVPQVSYVHAMPRITRAVSFDREHVRLFTSQIIRTNILSGGAIIIDDTLSPASSIVAGDSLIEIGFSQPLPPGVHFARVNSFELRDQFNSPFDTMLHTQWITKTDSIPDRFYIIRWTFEQLTGEVRIHIIFNEVPGPSAFDVAHYTLTPFGTLVRVYADSANPNAVYIEVGSDMQLVALGVPFVLCVNGIVSATNTPLDAREGNCAGVSFTEPTLANVMVYPNPAKLSDGHLTFSRLTAHADIDIYTLNRRFIRHISSIEQLGGVNWDMRDENGNPVPSGMYLYFATGKDDFGIDVAGQAAKLVIVDDN